MTKATAPATIGVAIEVPLNRANRSLRGGFITGNPFAILGTRTVDMMLTPGPLRSGFAPLKDVGPWLLKEDGRNVDLVIAPTVIAPSACPGHASSVSKLPPKPD
jgi:hypothetical protein